MAFSLLFISRYCCLLAIIIFGFSRFLQCFSRHFQLLLGLTCTYLVVVYISIRGLCSHRHAFIFYPFPLPLTPYSIPHYLFIELDQTSLNLYLLLRVHVLRYPSTHLLTLSTLTFVLFTLRSALLMTNLSRLAKPSLPVLY